VGSDVRTGCFVGNTERGSSAMAPESHCNPT